MMWSLWFTSVSAPISFQTFHVAKDETTNTTTIPSSQLILKSVSSISPTPTLGLTDSLKFLVVLPQPLSRLRWSGSCVNRGFSLLCPTSFSCQSHSVMPQFSVCDITIASMVTNCAVKLHCVTSLNESGRRLIRESKASVYTQITW